MLKRLLVQRRVARGAAFLDRAVGPDWHTSVDPDKTRIAHGDCCILGQLFTGLNGYHTGCGELNLTLGESCSHGFHSDSKVDYRSLTPAWRKEVRDRQAAA